MWAMIPFSKSCALVNGFSNFGNEVEWNRMNKYTVEFHKRVRAGYMEMVKAEPQRWVVVNSDQKWEAVQEELLTFEK